MVGIELRDVVLLDSEDRQRAVELSIQMLALDSQLETLARHRIEISAFAIAVVLRLEDIGVARIGGKLLIQIQHQTGVGCENLVFSVSVETAHLPPALSSTHDQLERIGQRKTQGSVDSVLTRSVQRAGGLRTPGGLLVRAIPFIEVAGSRQIADPRVSALVLTRAGSAQPNHRFVRAPGQRERAGGLHIHTVLLERVFGIVGQGHQASSRHRVGLAIQVKQLGVVVAFAVREIGLELPAIVKTMLHAGKQAAIGAAPMGPICACGLGRGPVRGSSVGEQQRQTAPGRTCRPIGLVVEADARRGRRGEIRIHHTIEHLFACMVEIDMRIALFRHPGQAGPDSAIAGQRSRQIDGGATLIP